MACNWVEQLLPASFGGVPFEVDSYDATEGWDVVVREYPFQDIPTAQPMGETANELRLSAYVHGDDYKQKRDALAAALRGEKLLIHPTRGMGRYWVQGPFTISESLLDRGGVARFDVTFVKAQARRYPFSLLNTVLTLLSAVASAVTTIKSAFAGRFTISGLPGFVSNSAIRQIGAIIDIAERLMLPIWSGDDEGQAALQRKLRIARGDVISLPSSPDNLASTLVDLFALPNDFEGDLTSVYGRLKDQFNVELEADTSPYMTASRRQQAENSAALQALARESIVLAASAVAARTEFESYTHALTVRSELNAAFKDLLASTSSQTSHAALSNVHAAVLTDLTQRSKSYGRISEYTPADSEPLEYISYKLYATTDYVDELYSNNPHIVHPMLVPAGQPLKVISR